MIAKGIDKTQVDTAQLSDSENCSAINEMNNRTHNVSQDGMAALNKVETQLNDEPDSEKQPLVPPRFGFWDVEMKEIRTIVVERFFFIITLLAIVCFTIIAIYWGASYNRKKYYHKVNLLALIQDNSQLGQLSETILSTKGDGTLQGTWHIYNQTSFMKKHHLTNVSQVDVEFLHSIHHEDYWIGFNLKPNATDALLDSLTNKNSSDLFDSHQYFEALYESGRDPTNLKSAILPLVEAFGTVFHHEYISSALPSILSSINSTINNEKLIAASNMSFLYIDNRPFINAVVLSPLQVGSIYVLILTILQFGLWGKVHGMVSQKLKIKPLIFYRIIVSVVTLFFLSLFLCTVSAIYQIDFTKAFGRGGFLVYWMSTWLIMVALAGANENVVGLIIAYGSEYLSFWIITFIILNISPSFFPMALDSNFYRFGYAMPIYNAVDIYKVIFLDLSKHKMGRNYGILVAWCVLNYSLLPLFMKVTGEKMKKNTIEQMEKGIAMARAMGRI